MRAWPAVSEVASLPRGVNPHRWTQNEPAPPRGELSRKGRGPHAMKIGTHSKLIRTRVEFDQADLERYAREQLMRSEGWPKFEQGQIFAAATEWDADDKGRVTLTLTLEAGEAPTTARPPSRYSAGRSGCGPCARMSTRRWAGSGSCVGRTGCRRSTARTTTRRTSPEEKG